MFPLLLVMPELCDDMALKAFSSLLKSFTFRNPLIYSSALPVSRCLATAYGWGRGRGLHAWHFSTRPALFRIGTFSFVTCRPFSLGTNRLSHGRLPWACFLRGSGCCGAARTIAFRLWLEVPIRSRY